MRAVTHTAVERKRSRLNESNDQFRPRIAPEADRSSQRVGVVGTQAHMARMPCRCRDRPGDRSNGRLEVANARSLSQITRPVPHLCPRGPRPILNSLTRHRDHSIPFPRAWCAPRHRQGSCAARPCARASDVLSQFTPLGCRLALHGCTARTIAACPSLLLASAGPC